MFNHLFRLFGKLYPLYSGCGTIANSRLFQWATPNGNSEVWATLKTGAHLLVSTKDYVGRGVYYFGDLDPKITWLCEKILRRGDTAVDIGANIGVVTLNMAALVGTSGRVHAFEPQPDMVKTLKRSLGYNGYSHVKVHNCALGESSGNLDLFVPAFNAGAASFVHQAEKDCAIIEVPVVAADEYLTNLDIGKVRLLKIDVEGYEATVIMAARRFLTASSPDYIIFESNDYNDGNQSVAHMLHELDYVFFEIPKKFFKMEITQIPCDSIRTNHSHDILAARRCVAGTEGLLASFGSKTAPRLRA